MTNQLLTILQLSGRMFVRLLPYVIFGVIVSIPARRFFRDSMILKINAFPKSAGLFFSSIIGMISPLCTYGTLPIVIKLLQSGVPIPLLITFLCASSLMNPQLFLMTWGGISPRMAVMRVIVTLIASVLLGLALQWLPEKWIVRQSTLAPRNAASSASCVYREKSFRRFFKEMWETLLAVLFYVCIGILLGAAIEVIVPREWLLGLFGNHPQLSVLIASLLGVPLYACGGGTVPLVSSLMKTGMSPGAALAFLTAGPGTRLTPLAALASILRPGFLIVYIFYILFVAISAGILYF